MRRRLAVARAAVVLAAVAAVGTAGLTGCSDDGRYLRPPGTDGATARTEPEPGAAGA
ncbi:MAG TPA: sugar-binding protein, partial [Acidimicrobiaceae bacterium]|nr:sugar-binding protein [Acidimicrobiaceae bacterium]